MHQKEESLDRKAAQLDDREKELDEREQESIQSRRCVDQLVLEQKQRLEEIAGMSSDEARRQMVCGMEAQARQEAASLVRKLEEEARSRAATTARGLVVQAIQRTAVETVVETCVSVVMLPSDDLKGRIIGREGRNIRALEMAIGVNLIIDDTPEAILLSAFDGFRREVARLSIQKLDCRRPHPPCENRGNRRTHPAGSRSTGGARR